MLIEKGHCEPREKRASWLSREEEEGSARGGSSFFNDVAGVRGAGRRVGGRERRGVRDGPQETAAGELSWGGEAVPDAIVNGKPDRDSSSPRWWTTSPRRRRTRPGGKADEERCRTRPRPRGGDRRACC